MKSELGYVSRSWSVLEATVKKTRFCLSVKWKILRVLTRQYYNVIYNLRSLLYLLCGEYIK